MRDNNAGKEHVCCRGSRRVAAPCHHRMVQKEWTCLQVKWLHSSVNIFQNIRSLFAVWLTVQVARAQTAFKLQAWCVGVNQ